MGKRLTLSKDTLSDLRKSSSSSFDIGVAATAGESQVGAKIDGSIAGSSSDLITLLLFIVFYSKIIFRYGTIYHSELSKNFSL